MISDAKVFRVLVVEYLSPTIGSELMLSCKLFRVIGRHSVTRASLEYNDCMITECRPISERIALCTNKDMTMLMKN